METFSMIDDGSEVTLLEEVIADQLGLKGKQFPITLQWYDNKKSIKMSKTVRIQIAGVHAEVHYDQKGLQTVKNLDLPVQSFSRYHYEHLTKPVLLIGLDNAHLGLPQNIVKKETTQPVAINTKL